MVSYVVSGKNVPTNFKDKGSKAMKKILTILAATATMFAFGAVPESNPQPQVDTVDQGANFEAFTAGDAFSAGLNDSAQSENPYYWYTADTDAANIISNYPTSGAGVPIASRPDKFAEASNSKYLQVETTGKLYRTVRDNGGSPDFQSIDENNFARYAFSLTNSAIYLDTLVKFTAADSVFGDDALETGDKIAIEYVEHESEGDGDPTVTNFVIRAGFKTSTGLIATNYYAYLPGDPTFANFDKDAWHRLTVRTIPDVGDGSVGFVVYVDETNLVYSTDVSAGFGTLDPSVAGFYNNEKHALFPSAVLTTKLEGKAISAAAFSGNGSLDDVVFTTSTPNFIKAGESVVVTINKGTGITGVTVTVGSDEVAPVDATANPLVYNLAPGTQLFGITATPDTENGYVLAGISGEGATWQEASGTVEFTGSALALSVTATRNNVTYIDSEDQQRSAASLAIALAAAKAGTTVKLAYDYTVADWEDNFVGYTINKDVVLDLNGKTINGGSSNARCLFAVALNYTLTVINTVDSDNGKIVYGGTAGVFDGNAGNVILGSSNASDYGPVIDGPADGERGWVTEVYRGKFLASENTGYEDDEEVYHPDGFGLTPMLDPGSTATLVGTYWVVTRNGAVGTYSITVTPTENATYSAVYTDSGDAIEPVNNVYTVVSGKTITITATPAEGFEYASEPDGWTLSEGVITKVVNEAVAIPAPTPKQSSEDWPEGQDLDDVAGKAAGEEFPGITNALATADAKAVATWATAQNVAYANKDSILPEAFLLNCANTQEAIATAAANFKITAITVAGDAVTITPANGSDYGNGMVVIEGAATLASPIAWHEKQAGDHFFKATLVVKPVAVP